MAYFPLFVDLTGRTVLLVGGGPVAARKARTLLDCGPRLLVCAPKFVPALEKLKGAELLRRPFAPDLLDGIFLAVAATGDRAVNRAVAEACRARSIPVNVADSAQESSFLFPALVRRGRLTVGLSSGGASPAASAWARGEVEKALPAALEPILDWLAGVREDVKTALPQAQHRETFARLLSAALEAGRPLTEAETAHILHTR